MFTEGRVLTQYIKENGKKRGVMVSSIVGDEICIGWSLCRKTDTFKKETGLTIAYGRLFNNDKIANDLYGETGLTNEKFIHLDDVYGLMSRTVSEKIIGFTDRTLRFFKDKQRSEFTDILASIPPF